MANKSDQRVRYQKKLRLKRKALIEEQNKTVIDESHLNIQRYSVNESMKAWADQLIIESISSTERKPLRQFALKLSVILLYGILCLITGYTFISAATTGKHFDEVLTTFILLIFSFIGGLVSFTDATTSRKTHIDRHSLIYSVDGSIRQKLNWADLKPDTGIAKQIHFSSQSKHRTATIKIFAQEVIRLKYPIYQFKNSFELRRAILLMLATQAEGFRFDPFIFIDFEINPRTWKRVKLPKFWYYFSFFVASLPTISCAVGAIIVCVTSISAAVAMSFVTLVVCILSFKAHSKWFDKHFKEYAFDAFVFTSPQ